MKLSNFNDVSLVTVLYKSQFIIDNFLIKHNFFKNILILDNSNDVKNKIKIEKKFKNVKYFLSKKNLGYSVGNNFLLKKVTTNYVFIVNPDVTIDEKNFKILYDSKKKLKSFGMLSPYNKEEDDFKIKTNKTNISSNIFETKRLYGCALFIDMFCLRKVNFFDENFFLFFEDVDLYKKLKKENYKLFLIKNSLMSHKTGQSSLDSNILKIRHFHYGWSFFYYHKKYYGNLILFIKSIFFITKIIFSFLFLRENKLIMIKGFFDCVFINKNKDFYRDKY